MLDLVYTFVGNLAIENKVIAEKVLRETCMVEGMRSILEYEHIWPSQFLETVCWMIQTVVKLGILSSQETDLCQ